MRGCHCASRRLPIWVTIQGLLSGATFVKFADEGLFIGCHSVGRNGKQQKNHDVFLLLMMHNVNDLFAVAIIKPIQVWDSYTFLHRKKWRDINYDVLIQ